MSVEPEEITFTVTRKIADVDGKAISEGDILEHIHDGDRGCVVRISRKGDQASSIIDQVGDMHIATAPGTCRCTNKYADWRQVPHDDMTFAERLASWRLTPFIDPMEGEEDHKSTTKDERFAVDAIMSLLPKGIVDWDNGPWPDTLDDALQFLVNEMEEMRNEIERLAP